MSTPVTPEEAQATLDRIFWRWQARVVARLAAEPEPDPDDDDADRGEANEPEHREGD